MNKEAKIFVSGHRGLVGSALVRELTARGYDNLITAKHSEIDLTDRVATTWFFSVHRIEYVFHCAARVGGIKANIAHPLGFFLDNINMQQNVLRSAADYGVKKLLFLGSSCCYPRECAQPMLEEYLLTGPFTKEVEAYGLAKAAGVKLCEWYRHERGCNFISALPCNIFGGHDNFDEETAHVIPGMMARMHRAKTENSPLFSVWGNGTARREFLYSGDLACALITIMEKYDGPEPINAGSGEEQTIADTAEDIATAVGYSGEIVFDAQAPVGTPRKIMDNSKLFALGWKPEILFFEALRRTYQNFLTEAERR